jgi:hypothetical protein
VSIKWDECSRSFIDDEFNAWSYTGEPGTWKPRIGNPNRESEMARKKKEEPVAPLTVELADLFGVGEAWGDDVYPDSVMRPAHYAEGRKYEPWDVIADWGLDYFLGSATKYISRAGRKGDAREDIQKAIRFLEKKLELIG